MQNIWFWLAIAGCVVVVGLAGYAGYLLLQVKKLKERREQQQQDIEELNKEQRERLNNSIQVIAQAMVEGQCGLTEGSIRVKVLLDGLNVDDAVKEEFTAFYQLATAAEHIPILEAWKSLSKKEQQVFKQEIFQLEKVHGDFVKAAAEKIRGRDFNQLWYSV
ncbi:MAG: DUF2489 domain-containing protein [Cellvibrionaceae bacterium]